jgi:hypothetical protein
MAASGAVVVPMLDGSEVEVLPSELPDDHTDITKMLRNESAPHRLWLEFAASLSAAVRSSVLRACRLSKACW